MSSQTASVSGIDKGIDAGAVQQPGMLSLNDFKAAISTMLGSNRLDDQMEMLFYKVSKMCRFQFTHENNRYCGVKGIC